jgi:uncharacterized protein (TIGR00730 family)
MTIRSSRGSRVSGNWDSAKTIAVFGGSRVDRGSRLYAEAENLGALLARAGFALINGGYTGTMEATAKGAREAGGRVIGVTSTVFPGSVLNEYVDEEIPTDDLYNRIRELIAHGDGYIILRGSIGTLAELGIVWNLASLEPGFDKPIMLLGNSWKNVVRAYEENLAVGGEQTRLLTSVSTPEECVEHLKRRLGVAQSAWRHGGDPLPLAPSPPE